MSEGSQGPSEPAGMEPTLEVTVRMAPDLHELLLAELADFDFDAFRSEGELLRAYGPGDDWTPSARTRLRAFLRAHDQPEDVEVDWITPENWNARWEAQVEPIVAGPFWITPSWRRREIEEAAGEDPGEHDPPLERAGCARPDAGGRGESGGSSHGPARGRVIEVDPRMSFGTGHHPSTRLALRLTARYVEEGDVILDAGAGTGVLAVAAARMGAARVLAFDNSPPARENGRETLARNGVGDRVEYRLGTLDVVGVDERFDGILANINREVLLQLLPELAARLAPNGFLVLSGLLVGAQPEMEEALEEAGLRRREEVTEKDWFAWAVERADAETGPVPRRVVSIDVGTNTVLLLVADVAADGTLRVLDHRERFARLGAGLDASGRLREAAVERVLAILREYRALADRYGVETVVAGGTSAVRDAANAEELRRWIEDETGIVLRTLSGAEEAKLTFEGALSAHRDRAGSYVVIDVGGGSTELITGQVERDPPTPRLDRRVSLDVGAVRMTERFLAGRPPRAEEIERLDEHLRSMLGGLEMPGGATLVGASGTTIALALLDRGVSRWDEVDDPVGLTLEAVKTRRRSLERRTPEEVRALDPEVLSGREDVFAAGVLIVEIFMEEAGFDRMEVVSRGIRHGLALRAAAGLRGRR